MKTIADFYTGIKTANGEKIYLGDKLVGKFYFPMLVQYDLEAQKFTVTITGKTKSPYRTYLIEDMAQIPGLRILNNALIFEQPKIGDHVKITVDNVKGSVFKVGERVEIVEVNIWDVLAKSLIDDQITAVLQFNEFLPAWRL